MSSELSKRKRKYHEANEVAWVSSDSKKLGTAKLCDACERDLPTFQSYLTSTVDRSLGEKFVPSRREIPLRQPCDLCALLLSHPNGRIRLPKSGSFLVSLDTFFRFADETTEQSSDLQKWRPYNFYCLYVEVHNKEDRIHIFKDTKSAVRVASLPPAWMNLWCNCLGATKGECQLDRVVGKSRTVRRAPYQQHPNANAAMSQKWQYDRYVPRIVWSDSPAYDLASSWLKTCKLIDKKKRALPGSITRRSDRWKNIWLIDCHTRRVVTGSLEESYIALSYVWGDCAEVFSQSWVPGDDRSLPDSIPATIEDAIIVTKNLGFHYLWADQYCIDQTPGSPQKMEQIGIMDLIYKASELTIINAAGGNAQYGLPGVGSRKRSNHLHLEVAPGFKLVTVLPHPDDSIKTSVWASRGWTFQEGMLARRRLIFTENEMFFESSNLIASESLHRPFSEICLSGRTLMGPVIQSGARIGYFASLCKNHGSTSHYITRSNSDSKFRQAAKNYMMRNFTVPADRSVALKGFLETLYPSQNAYGVPTSAGSGATIDEREMDPLSESDRLSVSVTQALGWSTNSYYIGGKTVPVERCPDIPTFSWFGWKWQPTKPPSIEPHFNLGMTVHSYIRVLEASFSDLQQPDPPSILKLEAYICNLKIRISSTPSLFERVSVDVITPVTFERPKFQIYDTSLPRQKESTQLVEFVVLGFGDRLHPGGELYGEALYGILVRRIDGYAERIGWLEIGVERGSKRPLLSAEDFNEAFGGEFSREVVTLR